MDRTNRYLVHKFLEYVKSISYKPGTRVRAIWSRDLVPEPPGYPFVEVSVEFKVFCAVARDGSKTYINGTRIFDEHLFRHEDALEYCKQEVYLLFRQLEQHELDEWFMVGKERPFDPHRGEKKA